MQKNDERQVLFVDVIVRSESRSVKGLPPRPAIELLKLIKKLFDAGLAYRKNKLGSEIVYLSDIFINKDKGTATLLINLSDKKASDPAFSNPEKKTRRLVPKNDGEGQDNSAHVVWKIDPISEGSNSYLFLLEIAPGLTTGKIKSFINYILLEGAKLHKQDYETLHPDGSVSASGKKKKVFFFPKIDLHGHICDDFKKELDDAKIKGFEIYTESNQRKPWDSHGYSEENRESVHIGISKSKVNPKNWPLIKEVFKEAESRSYECARVIFETEDEISRSVKMYTDTASIVKDFKYIKKAKLSEFKVPLVSSYENIYKPIQKKIIELL